MKKIFRKIHLWLSVPFGLIISIICFSGAALVFEDEVMELCRHDLYYVKKVEATPLPIGQLVEKVTVILPDSVSVTGVSVSSDPDRAYQVSLSKPRRASIYVDQYTGEIKGKNERAAFFMFMFRTHRWLLDSMKPDGGVFWGKMIVGVSTLLFVFILITGAIIWIPRSAKALKNRLKIVMNKGWRRFWYDLHVAGGIYAIVVLLVLSLTGLTWSFSWYRSAFYKVFGVEMQQQPQHGGQQQEAKTEQKRGEGKLNGKGERADKPQNIFASWQSVYDVLSQQNPDYKQITVSNGSAKVSFDRYGNQRAADSYTFNPGNGEITDIKLYEDADTSGKIRGWIYSVHVGNWGGMFTRIITFLVTLFGATLPLTGYYLWIKRSWNKRKN
ncbi:PepSY-associated TM helix domain-containing protein [Parabacteroides bouchesdurhonensis]|uniref:PepSY-associated TM helix domain-containing protein n=1 Tax=Parabacteroides bouchesdurhonensis TaxID=1936995 RepID=UPI000C83D95A|nr:PepSY-associated TM helix domain-containing protein [Parabacteroides bouchesdurhonensis]